MFTFTVVPLALATLALANVFIINPVSTTTFTAGDEATVTWQESGDGPSLTDFGKATFGIYVGNANQQTLLQTIATNVDVSATSSFTFKPDPTIGPNSPEYFIRVTSDSLKNPNSPQYYEEAFSAKFTLAAMSGSFNTTLQAQINGQTTAPIGGSSTASSPSVTAASTGVSAATASKFLTTTASTAATTKASTIGTSSTASATSPSASTNGAGKPFMATGLVALIATLVGASFL